MNIFVVGFPISGRTTVSKSLTQEGYQYIDAGAWALNSFRDIKLGEHPQQYKDQYHSYYLNKLKLNPQLCVNNIKKSMLSCDNEEFVIDGINTPRDFIQLFNYNEDMVVFLNRIDNEKEVEDYESIGLSVTRDYCFWLSSAGFLDKSRWIEFNFKIPGEESDFIKQLGSKNSVYIVKSLDRVIFHLKGIIKCTNK